MNTANSTRPLSRALRIGLLLLCLQALAVGLLCAFFPLRMWVLRQAIPIDYFDPEMVRPDVFEQVSGPIYAFKHGLNRSLIVDAGDALAVFDTFSRAHCRRLQAELTRRFPNKPVHWVFYSHNHLDHIGGAAELHPSEVIAQREVMSFVSDWPNADVLAVTHPIDGDVEMTLGSVSVQLLYLPRSHSHTLYAYYFPAQRTVFAPDTAFIRSFPPFGLPDWYYPGYIRALDRIASLDFQHCVPSHFERGDKRDFLAYRRMMIDYRQAGAAAVAAMGGEASSGVELRKHFGPAYFALQAKYGSWRGFDAMFIPHFTGQVGGTYLGY